MIPTGSDRPPARSQTEGGKWCTPRIAVHATHAQPVGDRWGDTTPEVCTPHAQMVRGGGWIPQHPTRRGRGHQRAHTTRRLQGTQGEGRGGRKSVRAHYTHPEGKGGGGKPRLAEHPLLARPTGGRGRGTQDRMKKRRWITIPSRGEGGARG